MKYLKLFDNHEDYEDYQPDMLTPNVSYCQLEDEVHFNEFRDTRLVAKFNVTSTSEPTLIADSVDPITSYFSAIEIDGVNMEAMSSSYTFGRTGEHIVKYTLVDPTEVGDNALYECTNVTDVIIPDSVTRIGEYSFSESGLESVNLPKNLTDIDNYAFQQCRNLKRVIIPDSVTTLGNGVFGDCTSLEMVVIGNGVTEIPNGAFAQCSSLTNVVIPNSVVKIGSQAFFTCAALKQVKFGSGLQEIGTQAFRYCLYLNSDIVLPSSVTFIADQAFNTELNSITLTSTTPPKLHTKGSNIESTTSVFGFAGHSQSPTPPQKQTYPIYVPSGSISTYESAAYWSFYDDDGRIQASTNS